MTFAEVGILVAVIATVVAGIGGIFSIYSHFKSPQIKIEKTQAIHDIEEKNRAAILAKELEWTKEIYEKRRCEDNISTDRRFTEMKITIDGYNVIALNHTHETNVKVEQLEKTISLLTTTVSGELIRLSTIIGERIPPKSI